MAPHHTTTGFAELHRSWSFHRPFLAGLACTQPSLLAGDQVDGGVGCETLIQQGGSHVGQRLSREAVLQLVNGLLSSHVLVNARMQLCNRVMEPSVLCNMQISW